MREDGFVREFVLPAVLDAVGDPRGVRICDLACGQGIVARAMAELGALVVGIDQSPAMVAIATRYEAREPLGISYQLGDAQELTDMPDAVFEGVVCNMALMDMDDLAAAFRAIARVLVPGGWLVYSITHPCFQVPGYQHISLPDGTFAWQVHDYFRERVWHSSDASGVRARVGAHHRTLSTYLNLTRQAGLQLDRVSEPLPSSALAGRSPWYAEVPAVLITRWIK